MQRYRLGLTKWLAVGLVLGVAQWAGAAEFSADTVRTGHGQTSKGLTYVKGQNMRQEMTIGQGKQIVIFNVQKKMVWSVDPAKKTYWSQAIPQKDLALRMGQMRGQAPSWMKTKRVGTETVSGYSCEKTQSEGKGIKATVWYSKQLGLALRTEVTMAMGTQTMTSKQEYQNIKERKLPEALFLPPAGYKQVAPPQLPQMQGRAGRRGGGGMMPRRGGAAPPRGR